MILGTMKNISQILLSLAILTSCSGVGKKDRPFMFPPEWEPHQAVWISIHDQWGSPEFAEMSIAPRLELVKALHAYVPVKLITTKDSLPIGHFKLITIGEKDRSRISYIVSGFRVNNNVNFCGVYLPFNQTLDKGFRQ
jgi:hypothetical protein